MFQKYSFSFYFVLLLFFAFAVEASTPEVLMVQVSKEKRAVYQSMLTKNKNVVAFIEYSLVESGLPKMMRNLSMIESSFNKDLVSSASAAGIWQFMEEHAADYGLKSEDRFDVYKSTLVAMRSLRNLYGKYGNWITVVAAYNCGEGNIERAMYKANSNRYEEFYTLLPAETIHHVYKFMQACVVTNEYDMLIADYLNWRGVEESPTPADEVPVEEGRSLERSGFAYTEINETYNLAIIAEEMEIEVEDLFSWNPRINDDLLQEGMAYLYLPVDRMPDFLLLRNTILNRSLQFSRDNDE